MELDQNKFGMHIFNCKTYNTRYKPQDLMTQAQSVACLDNNPLLWPKVVHPLREHVDKLKINGNRIKYLATPRCTLSVSSPTPMGPYEIISYIYKYKYISAFYIL